MLWLLLDMEPEVALPTFPLVYLFTGSGQQHSAESYL